MDIRQYSRLHLPRQYILHLTFDLTSDQLQLLLNRYPRKKNYKVRMSYRINILDLKNKTKLTTE